MATLVWQDGKTYDVPEERVQQALSEGFRPPTADEAAVSEAASHPVVAGVEAAARTFLPAAGQELLTSFERGYTGKGTAEVLKGQQLREQANPIASMIGSGVGFAAGPGKLLAPVLAPARAGTILARAGAGAVEGGLFGLEEAVNESMVDQTPLTAEKIAASVAGGALGGGVVEGGLGVVSKGASALMKTAGGVAVKDALTKAGDELIWSALARSNKRWADLNSPYKKELLQFGREKGLFNLGTAFDETSLQKFTQLAEEYKVRIADEMSQLEGYVPLKGDATLRNEYADALEKALNAKFADRPAYESALNSAKAQIDSIRNVDRTWGEVWQVQSDLFKDLNWQAPTTAGNEVREELRQAMRNFVYDEIASGKNKAGRALAAGGTWEKKPPVAGQAPVPFRESVGVDLTPSEAAAGPGVLVTPTTESMAGRALPTIYEPEGNLFHLPGQQGNRPLTVRLGEPTPEAVFTVQGESRIPLAGAPAEGPALPARMNIPEGRPLSGPEIEAMAQTWQGPAARTVEIAGEMPIAGGLVFEQATPVMFGAMMRQTGREARMAQSLAKAFKNRTSSLESGGLPQSFSTITALATGNPLAAVASMIAESQYQKRGGLLAGAALRKVAESKTLDGLAKSFQRNVMRRLDVAPELLGPFRAIVESAATRGAMDLLQTHVELMRSPQGADYAARMGIEPSSNESLSVSSQKLAVYDSMMQMSAGFDQSTDAAIDGLFGAAPGRRGSLGKGISSKELPAVVDDLKRVVSDPEAAFASIPSEWQGAAPGAANTTAATLIRGKQFLLSKAPRDPNEGMPASVRPPWSPSATDLDKFSQYKEAIESPERVLKNMANGFTSPEQLEALKAVYPAIYAHLQEKIGERLATWDKPLTFQQKLAFSAVLGPKALGMSQQQMQVIQQSQALAVNPESGQGSPKRPDGRQDVNEAQMETESQKLEARRGRV